MFPRVERGSMGETREEEEKRAKSKEKGKSVLAYSAIGIGTEEKEHVKVLNKLKYVRDCPEERTVLFRERRMVNGKKKERNVEISRYHNKYYLIV